MEVKVKHDGDKARNLGNLASEELEEAGEYETVKAKSSCIHIFAYKFPSRKCILPCKAGMDWRIDFILIPPTIRFLSYEKKKI